MPSKLTRSDIYDIDPKTGALIIGVNRLDDYATKFLKKYCEKALTTPMPLPIDEMLQEAKLKVETASLSRNLDIFGCCMLLDGYVKIYDPEKDEYVSTFYPAGTLLFDPESEWIYGEGNKRNTLIHEMIHWDKDQTYFKILERKNRKAKEKLYPIMCRQSRTNFEPASGKRTKQNEVEWLEWQAHRLAPRVLMPKAMFIKKAEEYLNEPLDGCDALVDKLADFFKVSRISAKIRLIEVGLESRLSEMADYADVFGEFKRKEHIAISVGDAFALLSENVVFEEWVKAYNMVFADGYFVVADKKYVSYKNGEPHLTKSAKTNLASCTLNICEQHIVSYQIAEKDYQGYCCLFHASGVDQRMLSFHPTYQAAFKEFLENIEWNEKMGRRSGDLSKVTDDDVYAAVADSIFTDYDEHQKKFIQMISDPFTTLCQSLWYWFENHGLRYPDSFHDATKLHKNYHTDIKNDAKNDMGKDMLMAICVGCKFDLRMTQRVLEKQKITLDEFQEPDKTYITLLERLPGIDINQFNAILKKRNLKELGSKSNSKKG
ncbi:MAG: hypothetical protein Q4C91_17195 [Eubacteriales bacterium]|nr:hypothetical protein [Eubacteriales bacterium]